MRYLAQVVLLLFFITPAVFAAIEGVPRLPEKAYAVEDHTVPGSNTMQAAIRMKSVYPKSAAISYYNAGVSDLWEACRTKARGWEYYVDESSGKSRAVHQLIRYWVSPKQRKMLTVIVRHYSKVPTAQCQPDSDEEHAVVVVSHSPELEKEIILLNLSCGLDPGLSVLNTAPPAVCK